MAFWVVEKGLVIKIGFFVWYNKTKIHQFFNQTQNFIFYLPQTRNLTLLKLCETSKIYQLTRPSCKYQPHHLGNAKKNRNRAHR